MNKQVKRETATEQVRIYPSTHKKLQDLSEKTERTIAWLIDKKFK